MNLCRKILILVKIIVNKDDFKILKRKKPREVREQAKQFIFMGEFTR